MTKRFGKIPIDLDVQRRVREAHVLRGQYVLACLRSLARSARSLVCATAGVLVRRAATSQRGGNAAPAPRTIEGDRS
jgi:hypothetical protein